MANISRDDGSVVNAATGLLYSVPIPCPVEECRAPANQPCKARTSVHKIPQIHMTRATLWHNREKV